MKKIYLFCLFLISFQGLTAQTYTQRVDEKLQLLDKTGITTDILYDRVFPMAKLLEFNENAPDTSQAVHFYKAYSEIQRADYNNRWQTAQNIALDVEAQTNAIPLGILNVDFEYLDPMAIADNLLDIQGTDSLLVDVPNRSRSPYIKENALVISPLLFDTKSLTVNFKTGSNFTLQAANVTINSFQVDFGNGQGYQNMPLSGYKTINFANTGLYTLKFKINLSNTSVKYTYAKIRVNNEPRLPAMDVPTKGQLTTNFCPSSDTTVTEISAIIGFQGYDEQYQYYGTGTFAVYKGGTDYDKPIIVLDGFDPFQGEEKGTDLDEIYYDFLNNPSNAYLGSDLTSQGYDIIPLNFVKREAGNHIINGGTDYIERNAMVLVRLLEGINNSSCWDISRPIKIIGFSMGGLVARYALRYMELNNIPHNTDLFISVDTPHKGAVVPMGLQQAADFEEDLMGGLLEDLANIFGDYNAGIADQVLKSPAARQMLKHHYLSGSESPAGAPGFHNRFYNTLDSMGWPQQTRNIAVVNGVTTGAPTNNPGEKYADGNGTVFIFSGEGALHFSPERGQYREVARFKLFFDLFFVELPFYTRSEMVFTSSSTGSLENAPGGYFGAEEMLVKFLGPDLWHLQTGFPYFWILDVNTTQFSFIPVKSALAYSGGNPDLYEDFSTRNLVCTGETPLDSYFTAQGSNQEHISLTDNSAQYIFDEITGTLRSPNVLTGDTKLNGPEVVCGANAVYNIPNCGASVDSWTVSSNLQIINETSSYVTLKAENSNINDNAYLQANYTNAPSIRKDISIGKPTFNIVLDPDVIFTMARAEISGRDSQIQYQGLTNADIEVISETGLATVNLYQSSNQFVVVGQGSSNTWSKWIKFTATNNCGTVETIFRLTPPPADPCNEPYTFAATGTNIYSIIIPPDPCGNNSTSTTTTISSTTMGYIAPTTMENKTFIISVYNFSGTLLLETDEKTVNLNVYKDGIYILKAEIDGKTYSKKVLKN